MASIRRRGDRYEVRIIRKGQPAQCKSFPTLKDAQVWSRRIEGEIDRGVALGQPRANKTTLAELVALYRKTVAKQHKGFAQEDLRLAKWEAHPLAKREAKDVRPADLAQWRDLRAKDVGASTIRNELAILSSVFEWARLDIGHTALINPTKGIRRPALPEGRSRRMDGEEVRRIVAATSSPALAALLPLAIATACRRGELLKVTWRDIDLGRRTLSLKDTKNSESRITALAPAALAILKALPQPDTPEARNRPLFKQTAHSITVAFRRAVERARQVYLAECEANGQTADPDFLTGLHLHDARHEACSSLFEAGLSVIEVSSMSGHLDLRSLKRYSHVNPERLALRLQSLAA
jgi:integrase